MTAPPANRENVAPTSEPAPSLARPVRVTAPIDLRAPEELGCPLTRVGMDEDMERRRRSG